MNKQRKNLRLAEAPVGPSDGRGIYVTNPACNAAEIERILADGIRNMEKPEQRYRIFTSRAV